MKRNIIFCITTFFYIPIFGQEIATKNPEQLQEVVVSDSRFYLKRENSGKTVIKITEKEIANNQGRTVAELINTKSGIEINGSRSVAGQNLGNYVRGGRSKQVLVLIDGIQVSDPSQPSREYDLRLLNLAQIASIEIIKGAASSLYGSGAATAVIYITTKKEYAAKIKAVINSSFATNQTEANQNYNIADISNAIHIAGTAKKFTYGIGFNHHNVNGFSAAKSNTTIPYQPDPFGKYNTNVKLGYLFSPSFRMTIFGDLVNIENDIDGGSFIDAANKFPSKQKRTGLSSTYEYRNGSIVFNGAYSAFDREYKSSFGISPYKSNNIVVDAYHKYQFNNSIFTVLGINYIKNEALFENGTRDRTVDFKMADPYANLVYVSNFGGNINAGFRLNNHSEYGSNFTYNFNPSYTIKKGKNYIKFFGSYATSFITPTLSQLFGNFAANPNLEPEENRTIEGGVALKRKKFQINALYFTRKEKNAINTININSQFQYVNIQETATAEGIEIEWNADFTKQISINGNYTFIDIEGGNISRQTRVPKHKANFGLNYQYNPRTFIHLNYQYNGDRTDISYNNGSASIVNLNAFSLVNLYAKHILKSNKMNFFVSLDNLLNESYTEIFGYNTRGRNVRIGFQLNL